MKVIGYYKKYIPWIILVFVILFAQAMCDLALPDYMSRIVSEGIAMQNMTVVWKLGLVMLGYSLAVTACSVAVGFLSAHIGAGASKDLRTAMFEKISGFSNTEYDKLTVSSLITRSTNDITQVQMFTIMLLRIVLYAPIMAIGGILRAIEKSAGMSYLVWVIVAAVGALLISILVLLLIVQPKFLKLQKLVDKVNQTARESLSGMMVVRAFNTQEHEVKRFDKVNTELKDTNLFVNRVLSALMPVIMMIMNGVSVAVIWIASYSASDMAAVGNMMAFMQYAMQIIMAFMMVTMVFVLFPRAFVSFKRMNEVLTMKNIIVDAPTGETPEAKGEVVFDNVMFRYGDGEVAAVEGISFTAAPGKTTALIGATGSGKTTLISLIPRLYDVSSGTVRLDGKDVRDYSVDELRSRISYVPQKSVLLKGTIKSNIKYSDPDGDDERMKLAASIAQANEFIEGKEDKFDFPIAQGGTNVSGGQKQRIAISRALYKDAPVYVFDDSFSALDFATDAKLRAALKEQYADKTVIIVAQRIGTIMDADQIIVLENGRIAGKGKHSDLIKDCAVYREIAQSQLSEEEIGA